MPRSDDHATQIAIPLFAGFTALDAIGPYEVLSRVPGVAIHLVAASPGPVRDEHGLAMVAERALKDLRKPDVIVVPGGPGAAAACEDATLVAWIVGAHAKTRWTTSVCTGALLLGAAGVLHGLRATTHWLAREELAPFGAAFTEERVVRDGKVMTAAGVSAGIDMAIALSAELAGREVAEAIQLSIEYDPHPPFTAGTPATAPARAVERIRAAAAARSR